MSKMNSPLGILASWPFSFEVDVMFRTALMFLYVVCRLGLLQIM